MLRFQRMMIRDFNIQPGLPLTNAWMIMNGFDLACSLGNIKPSIDLFLCLFKRVSSKVHTWAFAAAPGKLWLDLHSRRARTQSGASLSFASRRTNNNWDFDTRWKAPDRVPVLQKMETQEKKAMGRNSERPKRPPQCCRTWASSFLGEDAMEFLEGTRRPSQSGK